MCGKPLRRNNTVGICNRDSCRAPYTRRYRELNPDKYQAGLDQVKQYTKDHAEERREYHRQYRRDHPVKCAVRSAKARAKEKGLEFALTEDALPSIPEYCPVLGIPLSCGEGSRAPGSPSLDRIDSTRGYTLDNVHWISWRANSLKNDATVDELVKLAAYFSNIGQT